MVMKHNDRFWESDVCIIIIIVIIVVIIYHTDRNILNNLRQKA